jgi:small-conductance mechanosensitive channel
MNATSIRRPHLWAGWLIVVAAGLASYPADAGAETKPDAGRAVTTANATIPVDELELLLTPLTKDELADEAVGWLALLKAKAVEISAAEIAVKRENREIDQAEELTEAIDDAQDAIKDLDDDRATGQSVSVMQSAEDRAAEDALARAQAAAQEMGLTAGAAPPAPGSEALEPAGSDSSRELAEKVAEVASGALQELEEEAIKAADADEEERAQLFEDIDALRVERGAIIQRLQAVLHAWKAKGGETADYELYIEAVDDVRVDISDTVTAWTTLVDWVRSLVEELTDRVSGALFDIVIMVILALAVWIAVKVAVKRHVASEWNDAPAGLGEGEPGGAGATRVETLLPLLRKFISITLIAIVVMISLSSLGVDVAPLLAGAGMVGIAIGFGAQTLVRDVVSGLFFLLDDAFRMGEYVEVGEIRGVVEKISVRSLRLRHHRGPVHTIPFGEIAHLTNYSRDYAIMKFELRLPFETDINKVRKIIKGVGVEMMEDEELASMMLGPLKSQGINRMDDSALIVRCKFTAKPGEQFLVRREAYTRIQQALAEADIHFAPRRVIVETASPAANISPQFLQAAAGSVDTPSSGAEGGDASDKRN